MDDAKKIVDTDTQAVTKSQTAVNSDADTVTKDKATLAAATGDDTKKAQTQLDTDTKTQQTDQAALADAQAKQKKDQDDLANKQSVADDADANVKAYTANRDALRSAVSTGSTAAAPAFNPSNTSAALSDQATASIASAVRDIVSMSTDNGYTDACLILITAGKLDYADKMDCTNHLMRADDYKEHYLAAYASLLTPSTPDTKNALNSVPAPNPEFRVAKAQNVVLSMRGLAPPPAAAPPPPPPPAAAPPPPPPLVPGKFLAFFDFDKADLRPDAKQVVDQAATYAKVKGRAVIDVTGHTDTSGAPDYNLALSQRRASAVSAELIASGIPANEIRVIAKGQSEPLVQTGDRVREPQNRRVEIVFD